MLTTLEAFARLGDCPSLRQSLERQAAVLFETARAMIEAEQARLADTVKGWRVL